MAKRTKLKSLLLPLLTFSTLNLACTVSCKEKKDDQEIRVRNINGTDGEGLNYGCFLENDYVIDYEKQTVTYISSYGIHTVDLIIPDYVTVDGKLFAVLLGERCFYKHMGLAGSIELNMHITSIPSGCFYQCSSLTAVFFHRQPTYIGNYAFTDCPLLQTIEIFFTSAVLTNGTIDLEYVGQYAFYNCMSLSGCLSFDKQLKFLGDYAFGGCLLVEDIDMQYSTSISSIPEGCFQGCGSVSVALPTTITNIGNFGFRNCSTLENVIFVGRNDVSLVLGDSTFFGCPNLKGFADNCHIKKIGIKTFASDTNFHMNLGLGNDALETLPQDAFTSCDFAALSFEPDCPKEVGNYAFSYNSNLCILNFKKFSGSKASPPSGSGGHIFARSSTKGTVYLDKSADLIEGRNFLEKQGITVEKGKGEIETK